MSSDAEHQVLSAEMADEIIDIIQSAQRGQHLLPEREESIRRFIAKAMRHHAHERDNTISGIEGTWTYLQYSQVCILLDADVSVRDSLGIFDYLNSNPALRNKKNGANRGASSLNSELLGNACHRIQYGGAVSTKFYEMEDWLTQFSEDDKRTCLYQYNEWKKMPESDTIWKREDMQMENWCPIMDWEATAKQWFESRHRISQQKHQSRGTSSGRQTSDSHAETSHTSKYESEAQKPQKKSHKKARSAEVRMPQQIEYPEEGSESCDDTPQYGGRTTGRELQIRRAPKAGSNGHPVDPQTMIVQRNGGTGQTRDLQLQHRPQARHNEYMMGSQDIVLQKSVVNERGEVMQVWGREQPVMNGSMLSSQGRVQELDDVQELELYQQPQAGVSDQALVPQGYTHASGEKKKHSKGLIRFLR